MNISAIGLGKRYKDKLAVDDVSFTVDAGRVTGFLGPNGAGKSTTMRLLLGLDRPDQGRVLFDGRPLLDYPNPLQVVGSLLDARAYNPPTSAYQHLLAQAATHGLGSTRVEDVLALTGLTDVAGKQLRGFSLGMSQRVGLASALLADPQALILDEPVNGLDPEGVRWVRETVRGLAAEGRTVFLSSHLMSEMAKTADHIVVIGRGRILADAPVAEILGGGSVRVRSPQLAQLIPVLAARGGTAKPADDGSGNSAALVTGATAEDIGKLALEHQILLTELTPVQSSLEDAYLGLTADAVEYKNKIGVSA